MIERLIWYGLCGALALAPLPFAMSNDWSCGAMAIVCGLLLVGWCADARIKRPWTLSPPFIRHLGLAFLLVLGWAVIQLASWTPQTWHHPIWIDGSNALGIPLHGSIALDREKALSSLLQLATYGTVFWLSAHLGKDQKRAKAIILTIIAASVVYALYGLVVYFAGNQTILWYRKTAYLEDLTSTFVNKNTYATYAGLGWICVLALFYDDLGKSVSKTSTTNERLRQFFVFIERRGWRYLLAMSLLITALLFAHSRAGFSSTLVGIMAFCIALTLTRSSDRKFIRKFAAGCFLVVILFFATSGKMLDERFARTDLTTEERPHVYRLAMRAIADQPLLGSGLGSFEALFRFYRTPDIQSRFDLAHNTYLETALDLGIPAAAILFGVLGCISILNIHAARIRRRNQAFPCLGIGTTTLIAVHSLFDFSVQIPAVAITYAAIIGTTYAQSFRSHTFSAESEGLRRAE